MIWNLFGTFEVHVAFMVHIPFMREDVYKYLCFYVVSLLDKQGFEFNCKIVAIRACLLSIACYLLIKRIYLSRILF